MKAITFNPKRYCLPRYFLTRLWPVGSSNWNSRGRGFWL
jgi:hypothetical protein